MYIFFVMYGGVPLLDTHFEVVVAFRKNFFFRFFHFSILQTIIVNINYFLPYLSYYAYLFNNIRKQ